MNYVARLIKSMTRQERSHFTTINSDNSGSHYFRIYRLLARKPETELSELKVQFPEIPQIHYELNNLHNRLLRSIAIYQLNSSKNQYHLESLITLGRVLVEKRLYSEAKKILSKAKNIAEEGEKLYDLVNIISLEERVLVGMYHVSGSTDTPEFSVKMEELNNEHYECFDKLRELKTTNWLGGIVVSHHKRQLFFYDKSQIPEELCNQEILQTDYQPKSRLGKVNWHSLMAGWLVMNGRFQEGLLLAQAAYGEAAKKKDVSQDFLLVLLHNIGFLNSMDGDPQIHEETLKALREIGTSSPERTILWRYSDLGLPVYFHLYRKEFEACRSGTEEIIRFLKSGGELSKEHRNDLLLLAINVSIQLGEYAHATDLMAISSSVKFKGRHRSYFRLLSLCVYLEMENSQLVKSTLTSLKNIMKAEQSYHPAAEIVMPLASVFLRNNELAAEDFQGALTQAKQQIESFGDISVIEFNAENWLSQMVSAKEPVKKENLTA